MKSVCCCSADYSLLDQCVVAVPGADVVDWLYSRVEGFKDRRDARKYASSLLKHGYLRHTVNKITFSEQCYYTFGDLCQSTDTEPLWQEYIMYCILLLQMYYTCVKCTVETNCSGFFYLS